jgi:hypothetical protein
VAKPAASPGLLQGFFVLLLLGIVGVVIAVNQRSGDAPKAGDAKDKAKDDEDKAKVKAKDDTDKPKITSEADLVAYIEERGGSIQHEENAPGKPVVMVRLFCLSRNWNLPSRELAAILSRRKTHDPETPALLA